MFIERIAPGLEVGTGRLVGVLTLLSAGVFLITSIPVLNFWGIVAAMFLAPAGWILLRAPPQHFFGVRGYLNRLVCYTLIALGVVFWLAGA